MKLNRILVATDFSAASRQALRAAVAWARRAHAKLRIVHVIPPRRALSTLWGTRSAEFETIQRNARSTLEAWSKSADLQGTLTISARLMAGPAARMIGRAASAFRADLLVVGARGEREPALGENVLGGTSAKMLATASTPLLLVRRAGDAPRTVVAAIDLARGSSSALEWASAAAHGGHLHVFHAYDVPFTARLEAYGLAPSAIDAYCEQECAQRRAALEALVSACAPVSRVSQVVRRGDPAALLPRYMESVSAELVVLGRRERGGRARSNAGAGSVCRYIANSTTTDVLVLPPVR